MMKWYPNRLCWTIVFILLLFWDGNSLAAGTGKPEPLSGYTSADVFLLILYVLLALVVSFLCSVTEAALLSISSSFIAGLKAKQPKRAKLLRRLRQDSIDQSLAAILTLNTIANTVGAVGAGAKAVVVFGSAWLGLFTALMTLMILFLSEIIPKTVGAVYWRKIAWPVALFVRGLILGLYPLIKISEGLTRLIARNKKLVGPSREEFLAMARIGQKTGQIDDKESRIIRNLFRFESLKAVDIMTPRTVISAFPQEMTVTEALESNADTPFSRLPIYRADLDEISGFILKNDMLLKKAQDQGDVKLHTLRRDLMTVTGEMHLSRLMEFFLDHRQHIALVADEYGGTKGIVTLEDVVETLLGLEIVDERDKVEDMQALARQQWSRRAKALGLKVDALNQAPAEAEQPDRK